MRPAAKATSSIGHSRLPVTPARYDVRISHHRRDPVSYRFSQHSSIWLVDLDEVPVLPSGLSRLCRFTVEDHLDADQHGGAGLRSGLDSLLAGHGLARPWKILMLANPRVLGYVFNPLSVFYCYDSDGRLDHTVAEVRNTYGGRHHYLLNTDETGRSETDKAFYVSPFYPVDGHYTMRLPAPAEQLTVTITLHRTGDSPFSAVLTGQRTCGSRPASLWSALRTPLATRAVMFGIRRHGITLYLRGLRPFPRPTGRSGSGPVSTDKQPSEAI